jgi:hypothetical protein
MIDLLTRGDLRDRAVTAKREYLSARRPLRALSGPCRRRSILIGQHQEAGVDLLIQCGSARVTGKAGNYLPRMSCLTLPDEDAPGVTQKEPAVRRSDSRTKKRFRRMPPVCVSAAVGQKADGVVVMM